MLNRAVNCLSRSQLECEGIESEQRIEEILKVLTEATGSILFPWTCKARKRKGNGARPRFLMGDAKSSSEEIDQACWPMMCAATLSLHLGGVANSSPRTPQHPKISKLSARWAFL